MSLEKKFSVHLRALRKKRGLTQEQLAEKAGLEYKYIQMLEGKTPPSATLRTLNKLAKALRVPVIQLLDFKSGKLADQASRYLRAAEDD